MIQSDQFQATWWGQLDLNYEQTAQWVIGPLKLAVQRLPNEWQVAYEPDELIDLEATEWQQTTVALDISALNYANTERYVVGQTSKNLRIRPTLADRPIITRPFTPLYVPAGEQTVIFVSSPLWVSVEVGDLPKILQEIPIQRPSDTWFGPSTMEGELCYASRTYGRLHLDNIPVRSHRAITQVTIRNRATSQLLVERLSLPVPYLSIFETSEGLLWTQAVKMMRTRDTGMATLDVEAGPPKEAGEVKLICGPRQPPDQNMVIRAFGALFR